MWYLTTDGQDRNLLQLPKIITGLIFFENSLSSSSRCLFFVVVVAVVVVGAFCVRAEVLSTIAQF